MKRRLFTLAAALSAALMLAVAAAWIVSYARPNHWLLREHPAAAVDDPISARMGRFFVTPPGAPADTPLSDSAWFFEQRAGRLALVHQAVDAGSVKMAAGARRQDLTLVPTMGLLRTAAVGTVIKGERQGSVVRNVGGTRGVAPDPLSNPATLAQRLGFAWTTFRPPVTPFHTGPATAASWGRGDVGPAVTQWMVPHWALLAALMPPPLAWLAAAARSRRWARAGRCAGCGYDLRESPGRCPECGRAAAEVRQARRV